jgi:hypothetical protein
MVRTIYRRRKWLLEVNMELFDKIKDFFKEEEEIVEPVVTKMTKVEIPPIEENEVQEIKRNLFFDEKDFEDIEFTKPTIKNDLLVSERVKEAPKIFKPTPIISPVYGVLDTNYKKEDIKTRVNIGIQRTHKNVNIDDVRQKAFGTLEEAIEQKVNEKDLTKTEVLSFTQDLFEEMKEEVKLDYVAHVPKKEEEVDLDYVMHVARTEKPVEPKEEIAIQEDLFSWLDELSKEGE